MYTCTRTHLLTHTPHTHTHTQSHPITLLGSILWSLQLSFLRTTQQLARMSVISIFLSRSTTYMTQQDDPNSMKLLNLTRARAILLWQTKLSTCHLLTHLLQCLYCLPHTHLDLHLLSVHGLDHLPQEV